MGDIEYSAQTLVMESFPVQLRTIVTLTNRSDRQAAVTFSDGCVVLVRAFRADRTVWDQRDHIGCTLALVGVQLAPGQVREFQTSTDARQILGSALPDGSYRLEAYLRPVGAPPIELSAGNVDLAIPRN